MTSFIKIKIISCKMKKVQRYKEEIMNVLIFILLTFIYACFPLIFKHEHQQIKNYRTTVPVTCTHIVHPPFLLFPFIAVLMNI